MRTWYGRSAVPFLVVDDDAKVISRDDFFVDSGPRETCCGGYWPVSASGHEGVVLISGGVLGDWFVDVAGRPRPGVRANVNLAANLLRWLAGDLNVPSAPKDLVEAIELMLFDIVKDCLRTAHGDSWLRQGLPEKVLRKLESIAKDEGLPLDQCLCFIDLYKAIKTSWPLFAAMLGEDGDRKRVLKSLVRANRIRNRLAHPVRLRLAPVTPEEERFLEDRYRWLLARFRTLDNS